MSTINVRVQRSAAVRDGDPQSREPGLEENRRDLEERGYGNSAPDRQP